MNKRSCTTRLGQWLLTSQQAKSVEIVVVLLPGVIALLCATPLAQDNMLAGQGIVAAAILVMVALIWAGLRLRGQDFGHIGLAFGGLSVRGFVRAASVSVVVFVVAIGAFVAAAIVMATIIGHPESADMSDYDYLRGNLPALILSLASVYITASFGEEVIYRGFLITRLREMRATARPAWASAVSISAVLFGLAHVSWGLAGVVQTTCMGVALGASYLLVRRNLWITILAHGYMDTILVVQLYLSEPS